MLIIVRAKGTKKSAMKLFEMLKPGVVITDALTFNKGLYGFLSERDVVINWGCSKLKTRNYHILNRPEAVSLAINKHEAYVCLCNNHINTPAMTNSKEIAGIWFEEDDDPVFCRTLIKSSRGRGIVIAHSPDELVDAPLYTAWLPNTHEFRVHVFNGEVIDYVQKKKKRDVEADLYIRNHDRGWVFAHDNIIVRKKIKELAVNAVEALGLHFGAVDVLAKLDPPVNGKWQLVNSAVCEVNTAPGLSNTATLAAYVEAFNFYR